MKWKRKGREGEGNEWKGCDEMRIEGKKTEEGEAKGRNEWDEPKWQ